MLTSWSAKGKGYICTAFTSACQHARCDPPLLQVVVLKRKCGVMKIMLMIMVIVMTVVMEIFTLVLFITDPS